MKNIGFYSYAALTFSLKYLFIFFYANGFRKLILYTFISVLTIVYLNAILKIVNNLLF